MRLARLATAAIFATTAYGYSWQIPGSEGSDYKDGEIVEIHSDLATSPEVAAFKFEHEWAWCKPSDVKERKTLKIKDVRTDEEREMVDSSFYYTIN
jgi:hypothetical protein